MNLTMAIIGVKYSEAIQNQSGQAPKNKVLEGYNMQNLIRWGIYKSNKILYQEIQENKQQKRNFFDFKLGRSSILQQFKNSPSNSKQADASMNQDMIGNTIKRDKSGKVHPLSGLSEISGEIMVPRLQLDLSPNNVQNDSIIEQSMRKSNDVESVFVDQPANLKSNNDNNLLYDDYSLATPKIKLKKQKSNYSQKNIFAKKLIGRQITLNNPFKKQNTIKSPSNMQLKQQLKSMKQKQISSFMNMRNNTQQYNENEDINNNETVMQINSKRLIGDISWNDNQSVQFIDPSILANKLESIHSQQRLHKTRSRNVTFSMQKKVEPQKYYREKSSNVLIVGKKKFRFQPISKKHFEQFSSNKTFDEMEQASIPTRKRQKTSIEMRIQSNIKMNYQLQELVRIDEMLKLDDDQFIKQIEQRDRFKKEQNNIINYDQSIEKAYIKKQQNNYKNGTYNTNSILPQPSPNNQNQTLNFTNKIILKQNQTVYEQSQTQYQQNQTLYEQSQTINKSGQSEEDSILLSSSRSNLSQSQERNGQMQRIQNNRRSPLVIQERKNYLEKKGKSFKKSSSSISRMSDFINLKNNENINNYKFSIDEISQSDVSAISFDNQPRQIPLDSDTFSYEIRQQKNSFQNLFNDLDIKFGKKNQIKSQLIPTQKDLKEDKFTVILHPNKKQVINQFKFILQYFLFKMLSFLFNMKYFFLLLLIIINKKIILQINKKYQAKLQFQIKLNGQNQIKKEIQDEDYIMKNKEVHKLEALIMQKLHKQEDQKSEEFRLLLDSMFLKPRVLYQQTSDYTDDIQPKKRQLLEERMRIDQQNKLKRMKFIIKQSSNTAVSKKRLKNLKTPFRIPNRKSQRMAQIKEDFIFSEMIEGKSLQQYPYDTSSNRLSKIEDGFRNETSIFGSPKNLNNNKQFAMMNKKSQMKKDNSKEEDKNGLVTSQYQFKSGRSSPNVQYQNSHILFKPQLNPKFIDQIKDDIKSIQSIDQQGQNILFSDINQVTNQFQLDTSDQQQQQIVTSSPNINKTSLHANYSKTKKDQQFQNQMDQINDRIIKSQSIEFNADIQIQKIIDSQKDFNSQSQEVKELNNEINQQKNINSQKNINQQNISNSQKSIFSQKDVNFDIDKNSLKDVNSNSKKEIFLQKNSIKMQPSFLRQMQSSSKDENNSEISPRKKLSLKFDKKFQSSSGISKRGKLTRGDDLEFDWNPLKAFNKIFCDAQDNDAAAQPKDAQESMIQQIEQKIMKKSERQSEVFNQQKTNVSEFKSQKSMESTLSFSVMYQNDEPEKDKKSRESEIEIQDIDKFSQQQADTQYLQIRKKEIYNFEKKGKNQIKVITSADDVLIQALRYKSQHALNLIIHSLNYSEKIIEQNEGGINGIFQAFRRRIKKIVLHSTFENMIMLCVVMNTVILCLDGLIDNEQSLTTLSTFNYSFTIIFAIDLVLKLIGQGISEYTSDKMNIFDAIIVNLSIFELAFLGGSGSSISAFRSIRILRVFRVLRMTRLLRSLQFMKLMITAIATTLEQFIYILLLLFLFMFIYSLLGMSVFGGNFPPYSSSLPSRLNFDSFSNAAFSVLDLLTLENWNDMLTTCLISQNVSNYICVIYLISWIFIGNYVFMNLVLAIIMDSFDSAEVQRDKEDIENRFEIIPDLDLKHISMGTTFMNNLSVVSGAVSGEGLQSITSKISSSGLIKLNTLTKNTSLTKSKLTHNLSQNESVILEKSKSIVKEEDDNSSEDEGDIRMKSIKNQLGGRKKKRKDLVYFDNVRCEKSVYFFDKEGKFRRICYFVYKHQMFERVVLMQKLFYAIFYFIIHHISKSIIILHRNQNRENNFEFLPRNKSLFLKYKKICQKLNFLFQFVTSQE